MIFLHSKALGVTMNTPYFGTESNAFTKTYAVLSRVKDPSFTVSQELQTTYNLPTSIQKIVVKQNSFYVYKNDGPIKVSKDGIIDRFDIVKLTESAQQEIKRVILAIGQEQGAIGPTDIPGDILE